MGKFERDAREMLEAIGGKENIAAVTHCATRMSFLVLNDESKADVKRLEAIPAVKGHLQMQGNSKRLSEMMSLIFYNDFTAVSGIEGYQKKRLNQQRKKNQNWLQRALAMLAEIFTPIIPAIIVGGFDFRFS